MISCTVVIFFEIILLQHCHYHFFHNLMSENWLPFLLKNSINKGHCLYNVELNTGNIATMVWFQASMKSTMAGIGFATTKKLWRMSEWHHIALIFKSKLPLRESSCWIHISYRQYLNKILSDAFVHYLFSMETLDFL